MDDFLQEVYLGQVAAECEHCFRAIGELNDILAKKKEGDLFVPVRALIHHAAAVSRIFWPPGGKDKLARQRSQRRGDALRRALNIKSPHPVQSRSLRDHFEHFDERLDEWAEKSKNRNIVDRLVGPCSAIGGDAISDTDIINHYDPATNTYYFRGESFNIQTLATGMDDIYKRIRLKLQELQAKRGGSVA